MFECWNAKSKHCFIEDRLKRKTRGLFFFYAEFLFEKQNKKLSSISAQFIDTVVLGSENGSDNSPEAVKFQIVVWKRHNTDTQPMKNEILKSLHLSTPVLVSLYPKS